MFDLLTYVQVQQQMHTVLVETAQLTQLLMEQLKEMKEKGWNAHVHL